MGELSASATTGECLLADSRFELLSGDATLTDLRLPRLQEQVVQSSVLLWRSLATHHGITGQEVLKPLLKAVQKVQVARWRNLGAGEQYRFWSQISRCLAGTCGLPLHPCKYCCR